MKLSRGKYAFPRGTVIRTQLLLNVNASFVHKCTLVSIGRNSLNIAGLNLQQKHYLLFIIFVAFNIILNYSSRLFSFLFFFAQLDLAISNCKITVFPSENKRNAFFSEYVRLLISPWLSRNGREDRYEHW